MSGGEAGELSAQLSPRLERQLYVDLQPSGTRKLRSLGDGLPSEPIPSLPFEYWLGGGILWLAQHMTRASTAFVLRPRSRDKVRSSSAPASWL